MQTPDLPFRQIHLDFHTSPDIEGVAAEFDPERFADTLVRAHVNSVTCFGRCHHGHIYYDTKRFPERRHPHLRRNLLAEQIAACHKRGIRVPIYSTIQWDDFTVREHPEWLVILPDGAWDGTPPYEAGFYRYLCVNTPYRNFLKRHLEELFDVLPVDGLFLDIVKPRDCSCRWCRDGMKRLALDPADEHDRLEYGRLVIDEFMADMTAFIRQIDRNCSIFYNGGHVGPRIRDVAQFYSHLELESLPSGGWGYLHFPLTVRYARKLTDRYIGMTGRFHTSWGDFHSYKNPTALQFEVFTMLAQGARCSIGDQLHPSGRMDEATYDLIAPVYEEVEKKEPWCERATPETEIAVLSPEEFVGGRRPPSGIGAVRLLQEGAHQFDILDSKEDFSGYKVLVLPDVIVVDAGLARRIEGFVRRGGAVIATHLSGLPVVPPEHEETPMRVDARRLDVPQPDPEFALRVMGVEYVGPAPFSPDYIVPQGEIGRGLNPVEHVMYMQGAEVRSVSGEVLANVVVPYFNRTWDHYCSHRHTPSSGKVGYPGIVRNGRIIYFAHPVFTQYNQNAPRWCKQLMLNALDLLLPEPIVRHDGPTSTVVTMTRQAGQGRRIVHILSYIPERRGEDFDVIEDIIPLHDLRVSVREPETGCSRVRLVPEGQVIEFARENGRIEFVVPRIVGHQMVELT